MFCVMFVAVRYICAWRYDSGISKYKQIVLAFCLIHSVDVVLVTINNILLLLFVH